MQPLVRDALCCLVASSETLRPSPSGGEALQVEAVEMYLELTVGPTKCVEDWDNNIKVLQECHS